MAEDGFYRIVDITDILMVEKFMKDIFLMSRKPSIQFLFICGIERTAYTVLADDPSEPQQRRKHSIIAQSVDRDIPRETADDRKDCRAYDIAHVRSV
jgi:hypothetical protein